jgi:hypothetical protein
MRRAVVRSEVTARRVLKYNQRKSLRTSHSFAKPLRLFGASPYLLSRSTSAGLSSLNSPGFKTLSDSGPILVLRSIRTL